MIRWMRYTGIKIAAALEIGRDTVVEYLKYLGDAKVLNLLYSGQIGTFQPKTYLDRTNLTVIRPLIYLREAETIAAIPYHGMTPVKSPCPIDGKTKRETVKKLVADLTEKNPLIYEHLASAMRKNGGGEMNKLWPAAKSRQEMRESYDHFIHA